MGREWRHFRRAIRKRVRVFSSLEAEVLRLENAKAVHDMRVAARRLEEILAFGKPFLGAGLVRPVVRSARAWRGTLGNLRNQDVLLRLIEAEVRRGGRGDPHPMQLVGKIISEERKAELEMVRKTLCKLDLGRSKRAAEEILIRLDRLARLEDFPQDVIEKRLRKRLQARVDRFERTAGKARKNRSPKRIHAVRIAVKKVRYLAEVVKELRLAEISQAAAALKSMQDSLGRWRDLDMLENAILETCRSGRFLEANLEAAEALLRSARRSRKRQDPLVNRFFSTLEGKDTFRVLAGVSLQLGAESQDKPPEPIT